ncbi:MAG: MFS transporter [Gammaproteobacteria bacterium]|nr:MFS transporter [Gammaproteobacteria bacterium]
MLALFLVTFVNVLGFGLIIPILPFYIERVGGGAEIVTLVVALYSLLQFLAAPTIGKLSDRHGRRPVLIWTTAAIIVAHVLLAFADSLWLVIFARCLSGVAAGNVGVIFAYVTDVSSGADRAKSMGYIGASFSLGFMVGPAIGGLLAGTDVETANFMVPALTAAGLTVIALGCLLVLLPESLQAEDRSHVDGKRPLPIGQQLRTAFANRTFAMLSIIAFLLYVAWTSLLSIFALWTNRVLELGPRDIGLIFMYTGLIGAVCQLGLIGPLTRWLGEATLLMLNVVVMGVGLWLMADATTLIAALVAMTLLSTAHGIFSPVSTSLVSRYARPTERGVLLGFFQSVGGFGRVVGPAYAGAAFVQLGTGSPFLIGALLMVPCVLLAVAVIRRPAPA